MFSLSFSTSLQIVHVDFPKNKSYCDIILIGSKIKKYKLLVPCPFIKANQKELT